MSPIRLNHASALRIGHLSPFWLMLGVTLLSPAQSSQTAPPVPTAPDVVAGIPVNYDEGMAASYSLPDALTLSNGKQVKDTGTWWSKRRPEIVSLFETQQFGRAPSRPTGESFDLFDPGTPALQDKAIRKQVRIYLTNDKTGPSIHLLVYLPKGRTTPAPVLLNINFMAVQNAIDDPQIKPETVWDPKTDTRVSPPSSRFGHLDVMPLLDAGVGVATFYYGDVDPDYPEGFSNGIRALYLKTGQTERGPEDWGSIAAWAWGMSRVEDYFETDHDIDAHRVAVLGISRLGKTVMWAGALDQRFAAVIASCSGEGGAALSHRNYGETIAHLTAPSRYPYQFAENYGKYAGFPDKAPMDANLLIALIAPRPLLLQTGNTDRWSDPKGEFLAEVAAGPVYRLLGKQDLGTDVWPQPGQLLLHDLSYYMHEGGHGMIPSDWNIIVEFLKTYLHPKQ